MNFKVKKFETFDELKNDTTDNVSKKKRDKNHSEYIKFIKIIQNGTIEKSDVIHCGGTTIGALMMNEPMTRRK